MYQFEVLMFIIKDCKLRTNITKQQEEEDDSFVESEGEDGLLI